MVQRLTPEENHVSAQMIPTYKATRRPTQFQGCTQIDQIFLKADGKISCSCIRYRDILANASEVNVAEFFNGDLMRYIRESFRAGYEPFDFCAGCASRHTEHKFDLELKNIALHIEPSNQCNLFCSVCTCTDERLSINPPRRLNLDFAIYEKMIREIHETHLQVVSIALVGYGEPLFNSRTPEMAALGRQFFPGAYIYLDTNANFGDRRAEELADCGLNEIRLALDGMDQSSYEAYRANGDFNKAFGFARKLATAIRKKNSATRAIWKYILFRHNDRDDQILAALRLAENIGVPIIFDVTVGELASRRPLAEIRRLIGDRRIGCNIDPVAVEEEKLAVPNPSRLVRLLRLSRARLFAGWR